MNFRNRKILLYRKYSCKQSFKWDQSSEVCGHCPVIIIKHLSIRYYVCYNDSFSIPKQQYFNTNTCCQLSSVDHLFAIRFKLNNAALLYIILQWEWASMLFVKHTFHQTGISYSTPAKFPLEKKRILSSLWQEQLEHLSLEHSVSAHLFSEHSHFRTKMFQYTSFQHMSKCNFTIACTQ